MPATARQKHRLPIACDLPEPGLAARSADLKNGLFNSVEETRELPDGIAYRFPGNDDHLRALFAFVEEERTCCGFLRFELTIEPAKASIWLRVTGPEEAKGFIRETFGGQM